LSAGFKGAFMVGIAFQQVAIDAIQAVLCNLRPTGVVKKDSRTKQDDLMKGIVRGRGKGRVAWLLLKMLML